MVEIVECSVAEVRNKISQPFLLMSDPYALNTDPVDHATRPLLFNSGCRSEEWRASSTFHPRRAKVLQFLATKLLQRVVKPTPSPSAPRTEKQQQEQVNEQSLH